MAEFDLIERIRRMAAQPREDVALGIGDDAAVLAVPADQQLAAATDTLVEGVHFPVGTAPADLGWKALAVNLSDLAAMGATPAWALLNLTLPAADAHFVDGFAEGFTQLARQYRLALVGGDTTRGPLAITVSVFGFVPEGCALTRAGAQAGDAVCVTGSLGDAAGALHLVMRDSGLGIRDLENAHDGSPPVRPERRRAAPESKGNSMHEILEARLHRPTPRIEAGLVLRGVASACIDVSDGLLADLGHVARESGVGLELELDCLPVSAALVQSFGAEQARAWALGGGDDYELAFTVPEAAVSRVLDELARIGCGATCIGCVVTGEGVRVLDARGEAAQPMHRGWEHFS
jgi:thiamine-monophosphate kinase